MVSPPSIPASHKRVPTASSQSPSGATSRIANLFRILLETRLARVHPLYARNDRRGDRSRAGPLRHAVLPSLPLPAKMRSES